MSQETKKCKKCQTDIPKKANVCPQCRSKQGTPILAVIVAFFVLFVVIGLLGGGGNKNEVSKTSPTQPPIEQAATSPTDTPKPTESPKELSFGLNEVAAFPTLEINALEIAKSEGNKYIKPAEGKTFIGVKFEIKNISSEVENISSLLLFDTYVDDVKSDFSFSAMTAFGDGTLDGELEPGKKMIGWIAVEAGTNTKNIELVVKDSWLSLNKAKFKLSIE